MVAPRPPNPNRDGERDLEGERDQDSDRDRDRDRDREACLVRLRPLRRDGEGVRRSVADVSYALVLPKHPAFMNTVDRVTGSLGSARSLPPVLPTRNAQYVQAVVQKQLG